MSDSKIILVSQLGVNDNSAKLIKWAKNEGDLILNGEVLCELETTKATFDIEADYTGFIFFLAIEGDEVLVNQPLAVIAPTIEEAMNIKKSHEASVKKQKEIKDDLVQATNKAKDLAKKHGISLTKISTYSGEVIRESDVIAFISDKRSMVRPKLNITTMDGQIPVVIYGAGKGGVTIQEALSLENAYRVVCFIDDNRNHTGTQIGLPVYHSSELTKLKVKGIKHIGVGIASGPIRQKIKNKVEGLGFELINIIHPKSFISPSVQMGVGNYIKAGAVIETSTIIGDCCIIDNSAIIAHDNFIESGCHIAPGATFGSHITLGENTVVGIGASISTNINIGRNCIISVGASITQNVDDNSVIDGVPGKLIGRTKL